MLPLNERTCKTCYQQAFCLNLRLSSTAYILNVGKFNIYALETYDYEFYRNNKEKKPPGWKQIYFLKKYSNTFINSNKLFCEDFLMYFQSFE